MKKVTAPIDHNFINSLDKLSIFLIILVASIFIFLFSWFIIPAARSSSSITLNSFNQIQNGMTYSDVVNVIGEEGVLLSESDLGVGNQYKTSMFVWYGKDGISNANVMFQGGKVILKSQFGLQ